MRTLGYAILSILAFVALSFFLSFTAFAQYSFFAPRYTAVDYKVFRESQPYNEGMMRDLQNLRLAYIQADAGGKAALRDTILERFAAYPQNRLPPELQAFYYSLTNQ